MLESVRYPGSPMHAEELRKVMGWGHKLPNNEFTMHFNLQGQKITLYTRGSVNRVKGTHSPHRVYVECGTCGERYPFGRMRQHEKGHRRRGEMI